MIKSLIKTIFLLASISLISTPALAIPVSWTDWQSSASNTAAGQLLADGSTVDVSFSSSSAINFVQTGSGTNYWAGGSNPYTNGSVDNNPTASELISLNAGGIITISFSQTISDIYIALNSWNRNTVDFGTQIEIDSNGTGYWGGGTPILNGAGTGFYGSGEVHGVIKLNGDFDSISFSHTSENWHGFTLGVAGLASEVPEPTAFALFAIALAGFGFSNKKKR